VRGNKQVVSGGGGAGAGSWVLGWGIQAIQDKFKQVNKTGGKQQARQGTRDKQQGTRSKETRNKKQETRNRKQETSNRDRLSK